MGRRWKAAERTTIKFEADRCPPDPAFQRRFGVRALLGTLSESIPQWGTDNLCLCVLSEPSTSESRH